MTQVSKRVGIIGAALTAAAVLTVLPTGAQAERSQPVAAPSPLLEVGAPTPRSGDYVAAERPADVDTTLLQPGEEVAVSVDVGRDEVPVDLVPMESGVEGWSAWKGTVTGEAASSATVVRRGDDVAGLISTPDGSYRIRTTASGEQVVQVLGRDFPSGGDDSVSPPATLDLGVGEAPSSGSAGDPPTAAGDTGPVIEVLVAFTPAALTAIGGRAAMDSEVALSVATTNAAFADSGVNGRISLVGTVPLTEDLDLSGTSLDWLRGTNDGHSDQIHSVRTTSGADLVSAFVDDQTSCGLGYVLDGTTNAPARSADGFSTVNYACAVDNLAFAHELGHNMGLDHDTYVYPATRLYPYSNGYVNVWGGWRTIMSYPNQCDDNGVWCEQIGRFSNPDLLWLGEPTGRPASGPSPSDSRLALNNTQAFVASYRNPAMTPVITGADPGDASVTLRWTVPPSPFNPFTGFTVTPYIGGVAQPERVAAGATTGIYEVTGLTNGTAYTFRVAGRNNTGGGPPSAASVAVTPRTTPSAPTNVYATRGSGSATLTWTAPSDGGSPITGYLVTPISDEGAEEPQAFGPSTTQTVTGLTDLRRYTFLVAAVNAVDSGPDSAPSNLIVPGSLLPPAGDFDGNGATELAVFRPSSGAWFVGAEPPRYLGLNGDVPVPGDYDGNGASDLAVYRPSTGAWFVDGAPAPTYFGLVGDIPVPGDYDGDGDTDIAVYRPSNGGWYVSGGGVTYLGLATDRPTPADYDGDGTTDRAVFRASNGAWFVDGEAVQYLGLAGDVALPADYDGDLRADLAVFRPSTGAWYRAGEDTLYFGLTGDIPVPAPYDDDHRADVAVFRPSIGAWYISEVGTQYLGLPGDIPAPRAPALSFP